MNVSKNAIKDSIQSLVQRGTNPSTKELRRQGDAARDTQNWAEAATHYELYLAAMPKDAPIWVQLGHALKEQGDFLAAQAAYQNAEALTPEDADLMLQIGHLLKTLGRANDATSYYVKSLRLAPTLAAHESLAGLGRADLAEQTLEKNKVSIGSCTYFQINDFLFYLKHHKTVSGIQRVQLGVINYVLNQGTDRVAFVYGELRGLRLWRISDGKIRVITNYISRAEVDHDVLRRFINDAIASATGINLTTGDVFFLLGAFWGSGGNVDLLRTLKNKGVKTGIYFYDLIPVTHPEFCDDELTADFTRALVEALCFVDFGLAISEYTAGEVRRFVAANGFPGIPIQAVPLAHDLNNAMTANNFEAAEWPESLSEIEGRRYVLCVSTIEVRKNHRYLFDAWKALSEEKSDLPDLVLVGRHGWRVDDLFAQFKATNFLSGRIKVLHDLSDSDLAVLYRNCLFTVFPSIVEGWGLPIGESLTYGKVCVASNTSSMPEVGGDFVEYIDPWNLRAGLEVLRLLLNSPEELERREIAIRARFRGREWDTVSKDCLDTIARLASLLSTEDRTAIVPTFAAGEVFRPARQKASMQRTELVTRLVKQLSLHDRWGVSENFGTWLEGHQGHISFKVSAGAFHPVIIYMNFVTVEWVEDNILIISSPEAETLTVSLRPADQFILRVKTRSNSVGQVTIKLNVSGLLTPQGEDKRLLTVGLRELAYAPLEDALARVEILETLTLDRGVRRGYNQSKLKGNNAQNTKEAVTENTGEAATTEQKSPPIKRNAPTSRLHLE